MRLERCLVALEINVGQSRGGLLYDLIAKQIMFTKYQNYKKLMCDTIPNSPLYSRSISVICITDTKAGGPDKQNIKILNLIYDL